MDINVRLYGKKSRNPRQNKISARGTSNNTKRIIEKVSSLKTVNSSVSQITNIMGGNAGAMASAVPVVGMVYAAMQFIDKGIGTGTDIYQAHSGEKMLSSNIKAFSKTAVMVGMNITAGFIENRLLAAPTIYRQNLSLDYGREIYNFNAFGEKNKIR